MRLHYGNLYWDKTEERLVKGASLDKNIKIEVLIVGAGMSGNLCANVLSKAGFEVVVIEKDSIGEGSSAANTGLLQYSSDIMMHELAKDIGEEEAVSFYKMCLEAMDDLTSLSNELQEQTDFRNRKSIYYSSTKSDKRKLEKEFKLLKKYNFPVEYIDKNNLKKEFGINKPNALKTWHDADVNPYKLIQAIAKQNIKNGAKYYENTQLNINSIKNNKIKTMDGYEIEFKQIVLATGYSNIFPIIKDKYEMYRTYAFCSKPIDGFIWKDEVMFWETKDPYIYFRTTTDNRIIAGGLDEKSNRVEKNQKSIDKKNNKLLKQIEKMFPKLNIEIDFSWNALFGASKDGLPFIGKDSDDSSVFYLLGYEGNGTAYSMAGSSIILDLIKGIDNEYSNIVRVER